MLKDGNQKLYKQVTVGNTSSVISTKVNENKSQTQSFHLPSDVGYVVVNSLQAVTGLSISRFPILNPTPLNLVQVLLPRPLLRLQQHPKWLRSHPIYQMLFS